MSTPIAAGQLAARGARCTRRVKTDSSSSLAVARAICFHRPCLRRPLATLSCSWCDP
jgi:hypothetical protein